MTEMRFEDVPYDTKFLEPATGVWYTKIGERSADNGEGWVDYFHPREHVEVDMR